MIESIEELRALAEKRPGRSRVTAINREDLARLLDVYDAAVAMTNGGSGAHLAIALRKCEDHPPLKGVSND